MTGGVLPAGQSTSARERLGLVVTQAGPRAVPPLGKGGPPNWLTEEASTLTFWLSPPPPSPAFESTTEKSV